jgi:hypothetical protein
LKDFRVLAYTSKFFDWRQRCVAGVNLVKGRYPSMADSKRTLARPNRLLQSFQKTKQNAFFNSLCFGHWALKLYKPQHWRGFRGIFALRTAWMLDFQILPLWRNQLPQRENPVRERISNT